MEPIKINVSVELNLSEDVKNFVASLVSNSSKKTLNWITCSLLHHSGLPFV